MDLHREEIADLLGDRGFAVATDVGLSDFKVDISVASQDTPGRPLMAVLLDSPVWAARRTAGDRDGLPGDVLTRMMQWPAVQRVWLPAWLNDREAVLDTLEAAFAEAQISGAKEDVPELEAVPDRALGVEVSATAPAVSVAGDTDEPTEFRQIAGAAESPRATAVLEPERPAFEPWGVRRFGGREVLDTLHSRRSVLAVREAIRAIVDAEGPIHQERLAKLACAAFNLNKVNTDRANSVLDALDSSVHRCDRDGFIWDTSVDREAWTQFRPNGPDTDRKPEHISVVELRNAMVEIVRSAGGIAIDELHRETIRTFGGKRRTAGVTARLNQGLQYGVDTERLELRGDLVHLPGRDV
ncbi:DUF3320 domain-containing protein [Pseudarthrobacter sp. S9]|uniref:DUF3320 domain-containing protein n=1 Tax=Pseudarthrobacter sp. S9 TaxID=3418421 RepID=UPI003CFFEA7A